MRILVTGGTGFIGSHTIVELINAGHDVVCIDNLSNSDYRVIDGINSLTNKPEKLEFYNIDLRNRHFLQDYIVNINSVKPIDATIHFAAFKSVGESVDRPMRYYYNNISGMLHLIDALNTINSKKLIFSSSATVYGDSDKFPFTEDSKLGEPTNPYGYTKFAGERILTDLCKSDPEWSVCMLRYFNPVGAHPSGKLGEVSRYQLPPNIMPYICKVAVGELSKVHVFGGDYDTLDGTCIRDYTHVCDVASAHVSALESLDAPDQPKIYNIGTGNGVSVLELIHEFEKVNNIKIEYDIVDRRPGDVRVSYCSNDKIHNELGWYPKYSLSDMCRDSYNFYKRMNNGY